MGLDPDDPDVALKMEQLAEEKPAQSERGSRAARPRPTGKANRLAVFALFCAFVVPVLGIVFGLVALDEIDDSDDTERGRGMAQWAIGIGGVAVGISIAVAVWVIVSLS